MASHAAQPHRMAVEGEMTIRRAAALKDALLAVLDRHDEVELDLASVTRIDSAGVQLLLLFKRESQRHGRALRFVGHSPEVLRLMDLYELGGLFGDPVLISANDKRAGA